MNKEITEDYIIKSAPYYGKSCNEYWITGAKWMLTKLLSKEYKLPEIKWEKATENMPDGFADWNNLTLEDYCAYLERRYMFSSTGEAKAIFEIIKECRKSISMETGRRKP